MFSGRADGLPSQSVIPPQVSSSPLGRISERSFCMKKSETNPALFAAFMEIVDIQIKDNNSPETRIAFDRLRREGFSEVDAKKLIGQAIALETFRIIKKNEVYNVERFKKNLNRLPASPEDD